MSRYSSILIPVLTAAFLSFACSDDTTTTQQDTGAQDAAADQAVKKTEAGADKAVADLAAADQGAGSDAYSTCDFKALALEAKTKGTKINKGIAMTTQTAIATIKANVASYTNKVVQIQGIVVEICASQGCYLTLTDKLGNKLNLKVTDGKVDFRKYAKLGNFAIGEGIFQPNGQHGAQVFIDNYGAVIGSTVCKK